MKKRFLLISIVCAVFFLSGCTQEEESVVLVDGPILQTEGSDGSVDFNGAVVNTADFPVQSVYVVIHIKDHEENSIAINSTLLKDGDALEPEERLFFTVNFEILPEQAHLNEVEIYYDLVEE